MTLFARVFHVRHLAYQENKEGSKMQDNDKIISYHEMVSIEKMPLQRGMIFSDRKKKYSILLMSQRKDAIYNDGFDEYGNLIYEGHDARTKKGNNSKRVDQPIKTPNGTWTENGKFYI